MIRKLVSEKHEPAVQYCKRHQGGGEAKRAFEAMMPMTKIDIATIEAARRAEARGPE